MGMAPESVSREEWQAFQFKFERFMEDMRPLFTPHIFMEEGPTNTDLGKAVGLARSEIENLTDEMKHDLEFIKQRIAWYRPFEGYTHPQSKQEPHLPAKNPRTFADTENPDLAAANRRISAGADLKTAAKRLLDAMDKFTPWPHESYRKELAKAIEAWCNLEPTEGG